MKLKKEFITHDTGAESILIPKGGAGWAGVVKGNNFDGHFCIHFYGSKTHGTKKVDAMHQNCVAEAMKHSW